MREVAGRSYDGWRETPCVVCVAESLSCAGRGEGDSCVLAELGRMHGRVSFGWNGEEGTRGRQVWCGVAERAMRNEGHFWATIHYVHNNPVHHGYVERWQEWPYSSASAYLEQMGREEAARVWKEYPVLDYGKGWDDAGL